MSSICQRISRLAIGALALLLAHQVDSFFMLIPASQRSIPFQKPNTHHRRRTTCFITKIQTSYSSGSLDDTTEKSPKQGTWVNAQEAMWRTVGEEEWWRTAEFQGRNVPLKQNYPGGPEDKPILMTGGDNMYLGEWNLEAPRGCLVMHGFGINYCNKYEYKGWVYVGNFEMGHAEGLGKEYWLINSPAWTRNVLLDSPIQEEVNGAFVGRPFIYEGNFVNGLRHDSAAKVTLKDGTVRVGPWENNMPVGDWWHPIQEGLVPTFQTGVVSTQEIIEQEDVAEPAENDSPSFGSQEEEPEMATPEHTYIPFFGSSQIVEPEVESVVLEPDPQGIDADPFPSLHTKKAASETPDANPVFNLSDKTRGTKPDPFPSLHRPKADPETTVPNRPLNGSNGKTKPEVFDPRGSAQNARISNGSRSTPTDSSITLPENRVTVGIENERIQGLALWLSETIGHNPEPEVMEYYARNLYALGIHSVDFLTDMCTMEDFDSFDWMKPFHRRIVKDKLLQHCE